MSSRVALVGLPDRSHSADVVRWLAAHGWAPVTVDVRPPRAFADAVEASLAVPSLAVDDVLPVVAAHHRDHPLDGIALYHELTVEVSTHVAAALGLPHFPTDLVEGCVNKYAMRRWMRRSGVRCPAFEEAGDVASARAAASRLGYPVVVKPQRGGASYGVTRLDGEADLLRFFDHVDIFWEPRVFVIERYMAGREYSVESVVGDAGEHRHVALFEKPEPLEGPYFLETTFVTPGRDPAVGAAIERVVSEMITRLGLVRCITHTEVRVTPDGPVVVEFGLRPIGWPGPVCVRSVSGVDLVAAMARLACGEVDDQRPERTGRVAGWRYLTVDRPGVVTAVVGVERARAAPGVLTASVWAEPGSVVGVPPTDFNYIKGLVAVEGDTVDQVLDRLDCAAAAVRFETAPAGRSS